MAAPADEAKAVAALKKADPVLRKVIDEVGPIGDFFTGRPTDHYGTLVRSIVGQQLSTRSAQAIYSRLIDRFGGRAPTPEEVLADDPDELRTTAGLSHAKVRYLRSLAEHVVDGSLQLDRLHDLTDEEVTAELVAIDGIGEWSADMFLILHLHRPDVLAAGDLGIRRAVMVLYKLPAMPKPAQVVEIGEPWRPHRTLACIYLWRSLHVKPV
ncbi:MAG TPA: DNA-3-methyladenine glycosylase 2 family protein [Solirubrobacteraceae bacterium]|nr:DNA-3-methyladenine glycosylase 2 family protein [Solirubrobacteraceae bacterium]